MITPTRALIFGGDVKCSHSFQSFELYLARKKAGKQKARRHCTTDDIKMCARVFPGKLSMPRLTMDEISNRIKKLPNKTANLIPADSRKFFKIGLDSVIYKLSNFFLRKTKFLPKYFSLTTGFSANSSLVPWNNILPSKRR